jgi:hypothetical protein
MNKSINQSINQSISRSVRSMAKARENSDSEQFSYGGRAMNE